MYAPPESMARDLRPQYDQYSLAAVVYEALSGGFPHEGDTAGKIMTAKMTTEAIPVTQRVSGVPPLAAEAVMRALARDPDDRFESCGQFVEFFRVGVGRGGGMAIPAPLPSAVATHVGAPSDVGAGPAAAASPAKLEKGGFPVIPAALGGLLVLSLAIGVGFWDWDDENSGFEPARAEPTSASAPLPLEPEGSARPRSAGSPAQAPPRVQPSPPAPVVRDQTPAFRQAIQSVIASMGDPAAILGPQTFASPEGDQAFATTVDVCALAGPSMAGATNPTLWLRAATGTWDYSCGLGSELAVEEAGRRYARAADLLRRTLPHGWQAREGTDGSDVHADEFEARAPEVHVRTRLTHWAWGPGESEVELWVETDF